MSEAIAGIICNLTGLFLCHLCRVTYIKLKTKPSDGCNSHVTAEFPFNPAILRVYL